MSMLIVGSRWFPLDLLDIAITNALSCDRTQLALARQSGGARVVRGRCCARAK
jgi:hypothetical protein